MSINFKLIGRRIKEFRTKKKMTQADLAEEVDTSVTYISNIETASKKASLSTLVRIANTLCINIDVLLGGNQTNESSARSEFNYLTAGCNGYEKRFIYEIASAVKKILRENPMPRNKDAL